MATSDIVSPEIKEGIGEVQDYYTIETPDEELVLMIDKKIESVGKAYEDFRKEGKLNERYWQKNQLEDVTLRWHNSKIIQNRKHIEKLELACFFYSPVQNQC